MRALSNYFREDEDRCEDALNCRAINPDHDERISQHPSPTVRRKYLASIAFDNDLRTRVADDHASEMHDEVNPNARSTDIKKGCAAALFFRHMFV
jgi:hypothetical protein